MKIETKLKYKNGHFKIYVKKCLFVIPYWKKVYQTENKEHAITTLKNLSIISEL